MRKLASIQKVNLVEPIPDANAIEKIGILGWELVSKKGDFKIGDSCVYVEIDSILPYRPEFEFMLPYKFKVKTIRLRGQISQGIAFPLSIITDAVPGYDLSMLKEDDDVTELLGIVKWDPENESLEVEKVPTFTGKNKTIRLFKKYKYFATRRIKKLLRISLDNSKSKFPSYVPKTDETRVQTMHRGLDMHQGKVAYITEKLEGSSTTYIILRSKGNFFKRLFVKQPMKFIVCARNTTVKNQIDARWILAKKYKLESKMAVSKVNYAIQGELIGPKVQGNIYELPDKDFRMYLAYNIDEKRYLTFNELTDLSIELGIPMVPVLETGHIVHTDIKAYVAMAQGNSVLNPKTKREGIVIRLENENFSFKSINPEYLLEQKEPETEEETF